MIERSEKQMLRDCTYVLEDIESADDSSFYEQVMAKRARVLIQKLIGDRSISIGN